MWQVLSRIPFLGLRIPLKCFRAWAWLKGRNKFQRHRQALTVGALHLRPRAIGVLRRVGRGGPRVVAHHACKPLRHRLVRRRSRHTLLRAILVRIPHDRQHGCRGWGGRASTTTTTMPRPAMMLMATASSMVSTFAHVQRVGV